MRQQLTDPALRLSRQAREDVLQIGEWFVAVEAGGLDQASVRRPSKTAKRKRIAQAACRRFSAAKR